VARGSLSVTSLAASLAESWVEDMPAASVRATTGPVPRASAMTVANSPGDEIGGQHRGAVGDDGDGHEHSS
jgi:hypothetical protein